MYAKRNEMEHIHARRRSPGSGGYLVVRMSSGGLFLRFLRFNFSGALKSINETMKPHSPSPPDDRAGYSFQYPKKKKTKQRPVFFILKIRVFTSVPTLLAGQTSKTPKSHKAKILESSSCVGLPPILV